MWALHRPEKSTRLYNMYIKNMYIEELNLSLIVLHMFW